MLYATISRLDSLREIEMAMIAESRKLSLLGLTTVVPCDIQFSSSATHDHFMLSPEKLTSQDIFAFDRAYILSYPYFRRRPWKIKNTTHPCFLGLEQYLLCFLDFYQTVIIADIFIDK